MGHAKYGNNIGSIINLLTRQGRLNRISNEQIKEFKQKYFTNKVKRRLTSNEEDREHIPVVLLSDRKYALTLDETYIQQVFWAKKYLPRKSEGFRDHILNSKFFIEN